MAEFIVANFAWETGRYLAAHVAVAVLWAVGTVGCFGLGCWLRAGEGRTWTR